MSRTTARTAAMQMIFEKVSGGQGGEETLKMVYDELREGGVPGGRAVGGNEPDDEDREYITRAFDGVLGHLEEIDELIARTAKGWTLDRMALVDLTILRLAVWEILYDPDIPGSVSVAEAMEMTERYSDPDDKAFVNGILGTILREHEAAQ
ncbi:MAG: transcription antitermination factor NusB [Clostridiales bacterium]|nr:transcription antitermination factor NusB [Clostridiales bacterium]